VLEWFHYVCGEIDGLYFIQHRLLHGEAVFIATKLVFILLQIGRLLSNTASYVLMTIVSLSTFLAGIHISGRFIVLGIFIALATVFAAYLEVWVPIAIDIILIGLYIG